MTNQEHIAPVSVVIVNHNAGSILADCLRLIEGQVRELILVDNGSDKGALDEIVEKSKFDCDFKLLRLKGNIGFAAACNIGIGACTQDAVLLLNPDCLVSKNLVGRLWKGLESDPGVGMVGGFLQNEDQTEQRGGRRCIPTPGLALAPGFGVEFLARIWPKLFLDFNLNEQPLPIAPVQVEAISGACMMLRRTALVDTGLMDDGFFLHCEDLDLCLRFRNNGWSILFEPQARVTHIKGVCGRRKPLFVEWHKHKGMVRFYNKHFRSEYPAILSLLVFLGVWMRFAVIAIFSLASLRKISAAASATADESVQEFGVEHPELENFEKSGPPIGVIGASSFVGRALLPLLIEKQCRVTAFSRRSQRSDNPRLVWEKIETPDSETGSTMPNWVSLCPLPILADLLPQIAARGAMRLVAVSSTSRFTKIDSGDPAERRLARDLAEAEEEILLWAGQNGVEVVILRPTLIYDGVGDKNIALISSFIRRWKWFPILAPGSGLRQPLHVSDVALTCAAALSPSAKAGVYDLSGGETLSYREMVARIFVWEGLPQRILEVPSWLLHIAVPLLRILPRFRGLSVAVFDRMNEDMVFHHVNAAEALGFKPRNFDVRRGE